MQVSSTLSSSSRSSLEMYNRQAMSSPADGKAIASLEAAPSTAPEADTVSLHGNGATQAPSATQDGTYHRPPEVFAEIWKDGAKVGTVYTDGQAVLPGIAAGSPGAMQPYLRAKEISRQVGGEVRYVDIPALQVARTRAQLRSTYGA